MNKNTKIIIGIGIGLGVAYWLYNKKGKDAKKKSSLAPATSVAISDAINEKPVTREEQIAYILENTEANATEQTSGFEGVKFVWNKDFEKYYPVGTIREGKMPAYADAVFNAFEGDEDKDPTDSAMASLDDLSDNEIKLAYNLVKYRKNNPSAISEEEAFKQIGGNDPKIIDLIKSKIKPRLNDIKIVKNHPKWSERWDNKKKSLKSLINKAMKCGRRPINKNKVALWKKCIEGTSRKQALSKPKVGVATATDLSTVKGKEAFSQKRQKSFANQITNRDSGGIFAGKRFDGKNNTYEETIVRQGIV
jgi:hypothetical protein